MTNENKESIGKKDIHSLATKKKNNISSRIDENEKSIGIVLLAMLQGRR